MIPPPFPGRGGPLFILSSALTGVSETGVLVGASAVGAGKVRGAFYASLFWPPRVLSPHFKLARGFSFSIGGRRFLDFIRCVLP